MTPAEVAHMRFGIVLGLIGVALVVGCDGEKGAAGSAGVPCEDGCVTSESIADAAVLGNHIAAGAVGSAALADGSVTAIKLAPDSVGAAAIQSGAVGTEEIASQSIVTALLADLAVTTGKIADGAVNALQIAAGAVDTLHLADGAVETAKIAPGAVGTAALADGGVGGADLDPGIVGSGILLSGNTLVADTSVVQARISSGCVAGSVVQSIDVGGTPTCVTPQDARFTTGRIPANTGSNSAGIDCVLSEVRLFPGTYAPEGTFVADGRSLQISQHSALFSIIGIEYGGNGLTNFNLPDLRDQAPDGVSYVICMNGVFPPLP